MFRLESFRTNPAARMKYLNPNPNNASFAQCRIVQAITLRPLANMTKATANSCHWMLWLLSVNHQETQAKTLIFENFMRKSVFHTRMQTVSCSRVFRVMSGESCRILKLGATACQKWAHRRPTKWKSEILAQPRSNSQRRPEQINARQVFVEQSLSACACWKSNQHAMHNLPVTNVTKGQHKAKLTIYFNMDIF